MEELKNTIFCICISLILIGFFLKLTPKGKLSKNMKHLLSMVILLIILTPLSRGYNINWEAFGLEADISSEFSESDYKNRVVENVIALLKNDVEDYLKAENIGYYSVFVKVQDREGDYEISKITVRIKSGYDPTEIEKKVSAEFDLPCEVIIGN